MPADSNIWITFALFLWVFCCLILQFIFCVLIDSYIWLLKATLVSFLQLQNKDLEQEIVFL